MLLLRRLAGSFAVLLVLAGCSGGAEKGASAPETTEESTESTTAAETEAASEGQQQVTADRSRVQFEVPDDWQVLGPDALDNPGSAAAFEEFAERSGMSLDQLKQMAAQVDVLVLSPDGTENVNVVPPGALPAMPEEAAITADFERFGATVSGVEEMATPLGAGRVAYYALPVGDSEQHGASLFVETDAGILNLTATTASAARAPELMDQVAATLERAG